jgi:hypothetical protein
MWENMFDEVREEFSRPRRGSGKVKPAMGRMTAREVLQCVGTQLFRKMDSSCWARGLVSTIEKDGFALNVVTDARFPNEISIATERGAKAIRLLRAPHEADHESELALDSFPLGEYSLVLDNSKMSINEAHDKVKPYIHKWFNETGIL